MFLKQEKTISCPQLIPCSLTTARDHVRILISSQGMSADITVYLRVLLTAYIEPFHDHLNRAT